MIKMDGSRSNVQDNPKTLGVIDERVNVGQNGIQRRTSID